MQHSRPVKSKYDVIIVGARCAGAATAMLLARAGMDVLVMDRLEYATDTLSTHALMRGAVMQLKNWGLLERLLDSGTPAVRKTSFVYGGEAVELDISASYGVDCLIAPRRTLLDRVLVDSARAAGAEVMHGTTVTHLLAGPLDTVTGVVARSHDGAAFAVNAKMVIGADGRQSTVARLTGAKVYRQGQYSAGFAYGYFEGLRSEGFEWYFANKAAAGVIATNRGQHCVFVSVPNERFSQLFRKNKQAAFYDIAAYNATYLGRALQFARLAEPLRGFAGMPGYFRRSYGRGWALVGDAGYFKDPITAHGITDALRDAELLANAILSDSGFAMKNYQEERDCLASDFFEITDRLASFHWDLQTVTDLHRQQNRAMNIETAYLQNLRERNRLAA